MVPGDDPFETGAEPEAPLSGGLIRDGEVAHRSGGDVDEPRALILARVPSVPSAP